VPETTCRSSPCFAIISLPGSSGQYEIHRLRRFPRGNGRRGQGPWPCSLSWSCPTNFFKPRGVRIPADDGPVSAGVTALSILFVRRVTWFRSWAGSYGQRGVQQQLRPVIVGTGRTARKTRPRRLRKRQLDGHQKPGFRRGPAEPVRPNDLTILGSINDLPAVGGRVESRTRLSSPCPLNHCGDARPRVQNVLVAEPGSRVRLVADVPETSPV